MMRPPAGEWDKLVCRASVRKCSRCMRVAFSVPHGRLSVIITSKAKPGWGGNSDGFYGNINIGPRGGCRGRPCCGGRSPPARHSCTGCNFIQWAGKRRPEQRGRGGPGRIDG